MVRVWEEMREGMGVNARNASKRDLPSQPPTGAFHHIKAVPPHGVGGHAFDETHGAMSAIIYGGAYVSITQTRCTSR